MPTWPRRRRSPATIGTSTSRATSIPSKRRSRSIWSPFAPNACAMQVDQPQRPGGLGGCDGAAHGAGCFGGARQAAKFAIDGNRRCAFAGRYRIAVDRWRDDAGLVAQRPRCHGRRRGRCRIQPRQFGRRGFEAFLRGGRRLHIVHAGGSRACAGALAECRARHQHERNGGEGGGSLGRLHAGSTGVQWPMGYAGDAGGSQAGWPPSADPVGAAAAAQPPRPPPWPMHPHRCPRLHQHLGPPWAPGAADGAVAPSTG